MWCVQQHPFNDKTRPSKEPPTVSPGVARELVGGQGKARPGLWGECYSKLDDMSSGVLRPPSASHGLDKGGEAEDEQDGTPGTLARRA